MKKGIAWCPHCGQPHALAESVCPVTDLPLAQRLHTTGVAVAPKGADVRLKSSVLGGVVAAGRYQIIRRLGRGGMGEVFEARDLTLLRLVALKIVSRVTPEARKRLELEGKLIASLRHVNICDVFDLGVLEDGVPYLVFERLQGGTLAHVMKGRRSMPVPTVVDTFVQVLAGLQCAHENGVIHRDLKPANVFLVSQKGSKPIAKILDFGLAKDLSSTSQAGLTRPGKAVGTPAYMSPEQVSGRALDGRSDLFSIGIILFEALAGRHPFAVHGATEAELASSIAYGAHPDLQVLRPSLPPSLVRLIHAALDKNPDGRPQSARDFGASLAAVQLDEEEPSSLSFDMGSLSSSGHQLPRIGGSSEGSVSSLEVAPLTPGASKPRKTR